MASHLDGIIVKAAGSLGYTLKPEQKQALLKFVGGQEVLVSLPTGFGKSLCYILLPRIFDLLRGVENKCVIIVVSPLIALMKNQVASYVGDRDTKLASTSEQSVMKGCGVGCEGLTSYGGRQDRINCHQSYRTTFPSSSKLPLNPKPRSFKPVIGSS